MSVPTEIYLLWIGKLYRIPVSKVTEKRWTLDAPSGGPRPSVVDALLDDPAATKTCAWGRYGRTAAAVIDAEIASRRSAIQVIEGGIAKLEALRAAEVSR